jgi:membrane protease YdiL (CAAX protease family)
MTLLYNLHPRALAAALAAIDDEARAECARSPGAERRAAVALLSVAVCLLMIHYLKFATSFEAVLAWVGRQAGDPGFLPEARHGRYYALYTELWWGAVHLLGYVALPALVIRCILRERVRDFGLHWNDTARYAGWYVLLAAPIIGFAFLVSYRQDFLEHYPFYRLAFRSGFDLLAWELIYLLQFAFLEFFFRGFFLHACKPAFGANAVFVMVVPYLMIHFAKPWLEASGAILFGLFLGLLALRSRSIWGGTLVHMSVALSMDLLALMQTGHLPGRWWP